MTEDTILNRIAVQQHLSKLDAEDRLVMVLVYELECPEDWTEKWPPTYAAIGRYVGTKFRGAPLSEAAIRYKHNESLGDLNPQLKSRRKQKNRSN